MELCVQLYASALIKAHTHIEGSNIVCACVTHSRHTHVCVCVYFMPLHSRPDTRDFSKLIYHIYYTISFQT